MIVVVQAQTEIPRDLKVFPGRASVGQPVVIDLRGSQNTSVFQVDIFDTQGIRIDQRILEDKNPVWQKSFSVPGVYTVKAQPADMEGEYASLICEEKVNIDSAPQCRLWADCLPCYECVGKPVVFYTEAVQPEVGIIQAKFVLRNEIGAVLDSFVDEEAPYSWTVVFDNPGTYRVTSTILDRLGAVSSPCYLDIEVLERNLYGLFEIGPLFARASEGVFAALRVGLLFEVLPPLLDFVLSSGGGIALEGEPSKSFFMASALFNLNLSRFFLGAGIGYSMEVIEDGGAGFELVGNAGFYVFKIPCRHRGALFFELRAPLGSDRPFSEYNKLMFGFRYLF